MLGRENEEVFGSGDCEGNDGEGGGACEVRVRVCERPDRRLCRMRALLGVFCMGECCWRGS